MAKDSKTAAELEDMIKQRLNIGGIHVKVHKDPAYGWHPTVVTTPAAAYNAQVEAEKIAKELREKFDLKE
jgi:hypothetical protein